MKRARQWTMIGLGGGMLTAVLLVAFGAMRPTEDLWDQRLVGQRPQQVEASPGQAHTPPATVRLAVEGMVCYG
jgi:hypothetical protein